MVLLGKNPVLEIHFLDTKLYSMAKVVKSTTMAVSVQETHSTNEVENRDKTHTNTAHETLRKNITEPGVSITTVTTSNT